MGNQAVRDRTPCIVGEDDVLRVKVLATGGTIEKTYSEHDGALRNHRPRLKRILARLRHPSVKVSHQRVMNKDSLDMTPDDRRQILEAVRRVPAPFHAILIIHGTDTLELTGQHLYAALGEPDRPIVLTGAMRPFEFRDTDAFQNVVEALTACRLLPPGIYCVMHGKALRFPRVAKDRERLTFVGGEGAAAP